MHAGLDFYAWAGSEAFDTLLRIVKLVSDLSEDSDWAEATTKRVKEAKQYLKMDFKMHLKGASRVPDHCIVHALSDPMVNDFKKACIHPPHNLRCGRCEALNSTFREIQDKINDRSTRFPTEQDKNEALYDYSNAVDDIWELKKHIVRTIRQEQARIDVLSSLTTEDVYIHLDFAMKFLGLAAREPQNEW